MNNGKTIYKPVPGFPGYLVGSDGSVWSKWERGRWKRMAKTWGRLRTPPGSDGYPQVNLSNPATGEKRHFKVHLLVLSVFVGPKSKGQCARHLNGDRADNRLENLTYGSYAENSADTSRLGRTSRGERSPAAKLTPMDVMEIRRRVAAGALQKHLAAEFGVSTTTVCGIMARRTWRHL
jgi:hypothetical protein